MAASAAPILHRMHPFKIWVVGGYFGTLLSLSAAVPPAVLRGAARAARAEEESSVTACRLLHRMYPFKIWVVGGYFETLLSLSLFLRRVPNYSNGIRKRTERTLDVAAAAMISSDSAWAAHLPECRGVLARYRRSSAAGYCIHARPCRHGPR